MKNSEQGQLDEDKPANYTQVILYVCAKINAVSHREHGCYNAAAVIHC